MGDRPVCMITPTRLLYFGSRDWIDVPGGWTLDVMQGRQRGEGYLYRGPRSRVMAAQLTADAQAHPEGVVLIEGEAVGADVMARLLVAGWHGFTVEPYPVDTAIDGPWPAAGHRRNARMHRDGKPDGARSFITGNLGTPLSRGSAGMLDILRRAGVPTIVHRDDGVE